MFSAKSAAASGIDESSLASDRSRATNDESDARIRSGSRCVCTNSAFGYSPSNASRAQRCPGDFSTQRCAGCFDCRCSKNMRCHRYAGRHVGLVQQPAAYDGTRYCVGKIMLRKSDAVIRTHSCGSCAPIGCIGLKPGSTRSTPASVASTSAMRGSVS